MSQKERDRLKVIEQLDKGLIGQQEAAAWLGLSVRQVRRTLRRYQHQGDQGLVHQGRGKPSNRRLDEATVAWAKELLRTRYRDFGPTLASEHLSSDDAIAVSRETVRGWMRQLGLWGGQRKKRPHRRRRERRACLGELVQMDTSSHDWASHFRQVSVAGQKAAQTQIERALKELDIGLIAAHSPQAKGRVERSHQKAWSTNCKTRDEPRDVKWIGQVNLIWNDTCEIIPWNMPLPHDPGANPDECD
jgi:transposase